MYAVIPPCGRAATHPALLGKDAVCMERVEALVAFHIFCIRLEAGIRLTKVLAQVHPRHLLLAT